jgi:hypothetical protein
MVVRAQRRRGVCVSLVHQRPREGEHVRVDERSRLDVGQAASNAPEKCPSHRSVSALVMGRRSCRCASGAQACSVYAGSPPVTIIAKRRISIASCAIAGGRNRHAFQPVGRGNAALLVIAPTRFRTIASTLRN